MTVPLYVPGTATFGADGTARIEFRPTNVTWQIRTVTITVTTATGATTTATPTCRFYVGPANLTGQIDGTNTGRANSSTGLVLDIPNQTPVTFFWENGTTGDIATAVLSGTTTVYGEW